MPKTTVADVTLHYEVRGSGPPLLLISGLGYTAWQWHSMAPGLAANFRVITFDNRGVGQSDRPAGPYTAAMLAADAVGLLDALGIGKAHVMGHSMGGFVAQELVLSYPQRVDRLILASTNFGGPRHVPVTADALAVLMDTGSDPVTRFRNGLVVSTAPGWAAANPAMIDAWLAWRVANPIDPAAYQAQLGVGLALLAEDAAFEHRLPAVTTPTLILFGAHDKVVPPANAGLLAAQIAGSRVHILPNAGHFFPIETPDAANAAIRRFLLS